MTTLMTRDILALLTAARADDSDTLRLAIADRLEELSAECPKRVPCPQCTPNFKIVDGGGLGFFLAGGNGEAYFHVPCETCGGNHRINGGILNDDNKGAGSVVDRGDSDRAELMRLQCGPACSCMCSAHNRSRTCDRCRREAELLAAHPEWLAMPCPECKARGRNTVWLGEGRTPQPCPLCGGCGDLFKQRTWGPGYGGHQPGNEPIARLDRGLVVLTAPAERCWEMVDEDCRTCNRRGRIDPPCDTCDGCGRIEDPESEEENPMQRAVIDCPDCDSEECDTCSGRGTISTLAVHPWLAAALSPWVSRVEVSDKTAWDFHRTYPYMPKNSWGFYHDGGLSHLEPRFPEEAPMEERRRVSLPVPIWELVNATFPTAEAANHALSRAVPQWARANS